MSGKKGEGRWERNDRGGRAERQRQKGMQMGERVGRGLVPMGPCADVDLCRWGLKPMGLCADGALCRWGAWELVL